MVGKIKASYQNLDYIGALHKISDISFLIIALYLSIPGLDQFIQLYQKSGHPSILKTILTMGIILASIITIAESILMRKNKKDYAMLFMCNLSFLFIIGLGYWAYGYSYLYFPLTYLFLLIVIKGVERKIIFKEKVHKILTVIRDKSKRE
jgi:hypothetical protein